MAETRSIDLLFEAHARAAELRRSHGIDSHQYLTALAEVAELRRRREEERLLARR